MRSLLGRFHRPMSRGLVNNMLTMNNLGDGSTLSLDFTTMGGVLDPRLTFTRASTVATYINSSGYVATATTNAPRFDYSPTNIGEPRGLLVEGQGVNLARNSSTMSSSTYTVQEATLGTGSANDPSNSVNAPTLTPNIGFSYSSHLIYSTVGVSNSTAYTLSVYAKANGYNRIGVNIAAGNRYTAVFDLTNGTFVQASSSGTPTGTSYAITPIGTNGWYRCSVTMTTADTTLYPHFMVVNDGTITFNVNAQATFVGDTSKSIYLWGAQLELGSGASSYIPTGASQVTRNAEECRMTGTNFSSWFAGATEGVFFAEYEKPRKLGSQDYVALSTVYAAGALLNITTNTGTLWPSSICWPTGGALFPGGITTACPAVTKRAIRWFNGNDFSNFADGVLGTTSNGTGTLTMTMLNVGATTNTGTSSTADWLNSCIKKIKFYPTALPNADIQTLTTT